MSFQHLKWEMKQQISERSQSNPEIHLRKRFQPFSYFVTWETIKEAGCWIFWKISKNQVGQGALEKSWGLLILPGNMRRDWTLCCRSPSRWLIYCLSLIDISSWVTFLLTKKLPNYLFTITKNVVCFVCKAEVLYGFTDIPFLFHSFPSPTTQWHRIICSAAPKNTPFHLVFS